MRYPFKHICEYAVLRTLAAFLNALPYRCALAAAWLVARFAFHVLRFRRRETFRRIRLVFGKETPARRVREIAWLSLRNTTFNAVEMMRAPKIDRAWVDRHIPRFAEEIPVVQELVERHKGAVITVPHMGNWDLAGWACACHGIKMFSVATRQRNELIDRWINRQRECGMTILERGHGAMLQIMRRLRTGHVLAILPDVRVPTPDLAIPFLGGEANIGRGMAMFAISAKVPIVQAVFRRVGWTQHAFTRYPTIYPDPALSKEEDALRITRAVLETVDRAIRDMPEQWFWYNKRWILFPVKKG
ncbi:MAG: lysophospholipid acyltransferase family protein [Kiritimatiellae bacterium]|nr:lysophospholipid acyltransferase family protein [Kiritimatiellia bacterium]